MQYAVAAAERGDHAAIFVFDESIATLEARTEALGIKFKEASKLGQVKAQQVDAAELSPGEFAYLVRHSVVAQHGMIGSNIQSPVDTSYLADSVVLLRYFEDSGKVKKAISVVKKRSGAHEQSIRELRFDEEGIHLSEPLTQFRGIMTGVLVELKAEKSES